MKRMVRKTAEQHNILSASFRRLIAGLFAVLAAAVLFCGCGNSDAGKGVGNHSSSAEAADQRDPENISLTIVAATFPLYDWAVKIADGKAEVQILADNGVDLHSFQPSAQDLVKLTSCDLLLYVGGESDSWIRDALKNPVNPDLQAVSLMDLLGDRAREEELLPGMEAEEEDAAGAGSEEPEYDEHVWLSLQNAVFFVGEIAERMAELDQKHAAAYRKNAENYSEKLSELDRKYRETVDRSLGKTLLFADRFPFRYLTEDYGLQVYAAFQGCSAESEASFETVVFLAGKLSELELPCILVIENSDGKLAETVRETAGRPDCPILTLDSMQGVTRQQMEQGADYLSLMEKNLEVLSEALK